MLDEDSVKVAEDPWLAKRVPYRRVLLALFLRPYIAFLSVREQARWGKALLTLLLLASLGGLGRMIYKLPDTVSLVGQLTEKTAALLGDVWLEEGRLHWSEELTLPQQLTKAGWRVDILAADAETPLLSLRNARESHGVILRSERIEMWVREGKSIQSVPVLTADKLSALAERLKADSSKRLAPEELLAYARTLTYLMAPFIALFYALILIKPVFICVLIFVLTSLVFHPEWRRSRGGLLAVGMNCCIPPLVTAIVYSFLDLPGWDFQSIFMVIFLIYLLFVFWDTRSYLRAADGSEGGKRR
jgi:hypothetical protein